MKYHNITHDDMLNGKGLRVCLWVSGCIHNCLGCHNPTTHDINSGILFDEEAKEEIFNKLKTDYIDGITLTGGDPLHPNNREELTLLSKEIKELFPTKTIWLYTGFTYEVIKDLEIIKYLDVICDSKFDINKRSNKLKWVGSTNQRVIDVKKSLKQNNIILLGE
ncbi:MAG: anaerobic ribonucleoside-triphosphate reductase activating protein [bacterium]